MPGVDVTQVSEDDPLSFEVTVSEAGGRTSHRVTLDGAHFDRLRRGDESASRFIERCFEFLLAREPKESIMSSFDVAVIARYFPEFDEEIGQ
jgi:hypothetical protein